MSLIGEKFKAKRVDLRIPIRELARDTGLSRQRITRIEAGADVRDSETRKLCKALKLRYRIPT
jgi:transcriptional regulator with XRE-family HTH domain